MKETLKFVIELYSDYWKNPPIAEIYMNQDSKYKNYIKGTKENPLSVKVGDSVLYGKYSGTDLKYDGKDYLIMKESDILAIIN